MRKGTYPSLGDPNLFGQFYQSSNQARRETYQTQPSKKETSKFKTVSIPNKSSFQPKTLTNDNYNKPNTPIQNNRKISTASGTRGPKIYLESPRKNQISKQVEENSKKIAEKAQYSPRPNSKEIQRKKDSQVNNPNKGKNFDFGNNNSYKNNLQNYSLPQEPKTNFTNSKINQPKSRYEEEEPKKIPEKNQNYSRANQSSIKTKDLYYPHQHKEIYDKFGNDNQNQLNEQHYYKPQVSINTIEASYANQCSLQQQLKQEEELKKSKEKIQAVSRPTRGEIPKNKDYQVSYPTKGKYDEIHHEIDNKDPNIMSNNYYREQRHEISEALYVKQLENSKYDESHNFYASPSPNPDIYGRPKDMHYREDKNQGCIAPPSAVPSWNISNFQTTSLPLKQNLNPKPDASSFKQRKFNYIYNSRSKIADNQTYQNLEQDTNMSNMHQEKYIKNPSIENLSLKNQDKTSKDKFNIAQEIINNSDTTNIMQNSSLKNNYEKINDQNQRKFEDDRKNIIHPYNAAYDVKRTENPYEYRILCTPKSKSLENCNSGLPNIGNTCYMNSVLQILASTEGFDGIISCINLPFFSALANILKGMKSKSGNLNSSISQFKSILSSEFSMFQGYSQNDSKELFQIIISKLADEKPTFDLFSIKIEKSFRCGGHEAGSPEENSSFFVVSANKTNSIQEYINGLKKPVRFEGNNALYCDRCRCLRDMIIETKSIKTSANAAFYLASPSAYFNIQDRILIESSNYVLYGVICHLGTNVSGHYFAYAYCDAERSWVKYNDSLVSFENPDFRNAYMLFYKNKD